MSAPEGLAAGVGRHPITLGPESAWTLHGDGPTATVAWQQPDGSVILQGEDGEVAVPRNLLALLARGLLAAHVHASRP